MADAGTAVYQVLRYVYVRWCLAHSRSKYECTALSRRVGVGVDTAVYLNCYAVR